MKRMADEAERGEATCQQGAPCPDPTKCPDPVGCGHVLTADEEREAALTPDEEEVEAQAFVECYTDTLRDNAPFRHLISIFRRLDATRVALSGARADLALRDEEIKRLRAGLRTISDEFEAEIARLKDDWEDQVKRLVANHQKCDAELRAEIANLRATDLRRLINHPEIGSATRADFARAQAQIANLRAIYAEVAGRDPFEATERKLAAEDRAEQEPT